MNNQSDSGLYCVTEDAKYVNLRQRASSNMTIFRWFSSDMKKVQKVCVKTAVMVEAENLYFTYR